MSKLIDIIVQALFETFRVYSFKEFFRKALKMFLLLVLVFYFIYPQALDVFGRSALIPMAGCGFILYFYKKMPFQEVYVALLFYALMMFMGYVAEYLNGSIDPFRMSYTRTQMAWFFSAYLIVFILFNIHKNPTFEVIVGYIAAAFVLQSLISFWMSRDPAVSDFFYSIQLQSDLTPEARGYLLKYRIVGYGSYVFGGGAVLGLGSILLMFLLIRLQLKKYQILVMSLFYCLVAYIGLFTARTAMVGTVLSFALLAVFYFLDRNIPKHQIKLFGLYTVLFFISGISLAYVYFPHLTDWAFEMFYNLQETGSLSTQSSDTLYTLFDFPDNTILEILFGQGFMEFRGNDQGFARLLFYFGFIGIITFFLYPMMLFLLVKTKDTGVNLLFIIILIYTLILNVKGFIDLNVFLYLFFFFLLFYKYYKYYPRLYLEGLLLKYEEANNDFLR